MKNPVSRPRMQRAIAVLLLALVLLGAVGALVRWFQAADAAAHASRPAATEPAPHRH